MLEGGGKNKEALGFVGRGAAVGAVFVGERDGGLGGIPAEADEVAGVGLAGEVGEVAGENGEEFGGAAKKKRVFGQKGDVGAGVPAHGIAGAALEDAGDAAGEQVGDEACLVFGREGLFKIQVADGAHTGDGEFCLLERGEEGSVCGGFGFAAALQVVGVADAVLVAVWRGVGALGFRETGPVAAEEAFEAAGAGLGKGSGADLAVVAEDDHLVVATIGAAGGAVEVADGAVDAAQRPVGEEGTWTAAVGLFVVAEEVDVDDGQAAGEVDLGT